MNRRRESTDVEDLFIAHIAGMDTLARGLRNVAKIIEVTFLTLLLLFLCFSWVAKLAFFAFDKDGSLSELIRKRYQSFDTEIGAQIEVGLVCCLFHSPLDLMCNIYKKYTG